MDKTTVLQWVQDVEAAASDTTTKDSDGGSLSPNATTYRNLSELDDYNHSPHHHHRYHSAYEHHHSPFPPKPHLPDTWHVHSSPPILPSATLTPSSSFQVPEDPGKDDAPEVVKKFLRTTTFPCGSGGSHRARQRASEPEVNWAPRSPEKTGMRQVALRGASIDVVPSQLKNRQTFNQAKLMDKNRSWSPMPLSHPEPVQPTIDLSKETQFAPKRKMLLKTKLSSVSILMPSSFDTGISTPWSLTTIKKSLPSPKSAPVSPDLSLLRKAHSSSVEVEKALSHSNLVNLGKDEEISDTSPSSLGCSSGDKSSMDGQSNVANKGGFSDVTSSDGGVKMPYDSGQSSSSGQDDPVKTVSQNEQGKDTVEIFRELTKVEAGHNECIDQDSTGEVQESCNTQGPKPNSSLPAETNDGQTAPEVGRGGGFSESQKKTTESGNNEEELLRILKKWYRQGYGQKEDLARAMRLAGHWRSAHQLLMDEGLNEDSGQECNDDDAIQSILEAKVETLPPTGTTLSVTSGTHGPNSESNTSSPRPCQSSVPPSSKPHSSHTTLPQMTTAPSSSLTLVPSSDQLSVSPLPVALPMLSRKKLAELDKVNCFSFDDSSDDFLDGKPSSILPKNRNSPLSKTHSWSLSDYSSSHTSSSSYSGHAISPSYKGRSPVLSPGRLLGKHAGAESSNFHPLKGSSGSPLHRGYSVFTVPEESKEALESDTNLQLKKFQDSDDKKPSPEVTTGSTRLNFTFDIDSSASQGKF